MQIVFSSLEIKAKLIPNALSRFNNLSTITDVPNVRPLATRKSHSALIASSGSTAFRNTFRKTDSSKPPRPHSRGAMPGVVSNPAVQGLTVLSSAKDFRADRRVCSPSTDA